MPAATTSLPAQQVRIIGGLWKRSKLPVVSAPGLRPTPDRVRVTLFNWLGPQLDGWRCLDAFAGSGALGFEAASRGAASAVLLERDARAARSLEATRVRLHADTVRVECTDALAWMRRSPAAAFNLIFLDPPFNANANANAWRAALEAAVPLLVENGLVYLEVDRAMDDAELAPLGLHLRRAGRAGAVHFHLLQPGGSSHEDGRR